MTFIFVEGKFLQEDQAVIPLTDRGLLFGDGVFSTLRVFNGTIEGIRTHLTHLKSQCEALNLHCPPIKEEWLSELIRCNQAFTGIWRLKILVTGGDSPSIDLRKRQGRLIIYLKPAQNFPTEVRLRVYPIPYSAPLAHVKSLSYLDRLHMADYALKSNVDDVLVTSPEGYVLESSCANIFWAEKDDFFSPKPSHNLLTGATLDLLSKEINIDFVKKKLEDISSSAHVYLCNSIRGILPVVQIDERKFMRHLNLETSLLRSYKNALSNDVL